MLFLSVPVGASNDFLNRAGIITGQVIQESCQFQGTLATAVKHYLSPRGYVDISVNIDVKNVTAHTYRLDIILPNGLTYEKQNILFHINDRFVEITPNFENGVLSLPVSEHSEQWKGKLTRLRLKIEPDIYQAKMKIRTRLGHQVHQSSAWRSVESNHVVRIINRMAELEKETSTSSLKKSSYDNNIKSYTLASNRKGVPNIRIFMEDGRYVVTDDAGHYHLEGIKNGTHIIQIDKSSLPNGLDVVSCDDNTRVAGSAHSQFVEINDGKLVSANFFISPNKEDLGKIIISSSIKESKKNIYRVNINLLAIKAEAVDGQYIASLPSGFRFVPGSARFDDSLINDPDYLGDLKIRFRNINIGKKTRKNLYFEIIKNTHHVNDPINSFTEGEFSFYHRDQLRSLGISNPIFSECQSGSCLVSDRTSTNTILLPALDDANHYRYEPEKVTKRLTIHDFNGEWLEAQQRELDWLLPAKRSVTSYPSASIAIQHPAEYNVKIFFENKEINPLYYIDTKRNKNKTVARSYWQGVPLREGDNMFIAIAYDNLGNKIEEITRNIIFTRDARSIELKPSFSRLVADGKTPVRLVLEVKDSDGASVAQGEIGRFSISAPFRSKGLAESLNQKPLDRIDVYEPFIIDRDGLVHIELEPTLHTGPATLTVLVSGSLFEIPLWIEAPDQNWVLVGLGEISGGSNSVSGSNVTLLDDDQREDVYLDGRIAFYAKGMIKGEWLLTARYDSEDEDDLHPLFQLIAPDEFFTLYQDASQQHYDATSQDALYIKLSKKQFQALYGDINTSLNKTQLGQYERRVTGVSISQGGSDNRFRYNAFISDDDTQFIRDEIRGNGVSGLYFLSRQNIEINSESIAVEVRDRNQSNHIVERIVLKPFLDYHIDYVQGSIFFKKPILSRDGQFNPRFIVADYEVSTATNNITQGAYGETSMLKNKLTIGTTAIQETLGSNRTGLLAANALWKMTKNTQLDLEIGSSDDGVQIHDAYIANIKHQSKNWSVELHSAEQQNGYGLGHQNQDRQGRKEYSVLGQYELNDAWSIEAQQFQQINIDNDNQRDVSQLTLNYELSGKKLSIGGLRADDGVGADNIVSNLFLFNIEAQNKEKNITGYFHSNNPINDVDSQDYPERYLLGVDFKISESLTLYSQAEATQVQQRSTTELRTGVRFTPWDNATIDTSTGNRNDEYGARMFSNLGLIQRFPIDEKWSWDFGVDGSYSDIDIDNELDTDVSTRSGSASVLENFIAFSSGVSYRSDSWSLSTRYESRILTELSDIAEGMIVAFQKRHSDDLSYTARLFSYQSDNVNAISDVNLTLSLAYRPSQKYWHWFNRFDLIEDQVLDVSTNVFVRKVLNNGRIYWRLDPNDQISVLYGSRAVTGINIPMTEVSGFTQLVGFDYRHDVTSKWDVGIQGSLEYRADVNQTINTFGPSLGWSPISNIWFRFGFNFEGHNDQDLGIDLAKSSGVWFKLSAKFDKELFGKRLD